MSVRVFRLLVNAFWFSMASETDWENVFFFVQLLAILCNGAINYSLYEWKQNPLHRSITPNVLLIKLLWFWFNVNMVSVVRFFCCLNINSFESFLTSCCLCFGACFSFCFFLPRFYRFWIWWSVENREKKSIHLHWCCLFEKLKWTKKQHQTAQCNIW